MAFQVRHKDRGVFQGNFLSLMFWHPLSESPEYGLYEFPEEKDAQEFVAYICANETGTGVVPSDFTVEPFDENLAKEMQHG